MELPPELTPAPRAPLAALIPVAEPNAHERGLNGCATIVGGWLVGAAAIGYFGLEHPLLSGLVLLAPPAVAGAVNTLQTAVRRGRRRIQAWADAATAAGWRETERTRDQRRLQAPGGVVVDLKADPAAQIRVTVRAPLPPGGAYADVQLGREVEGAAIAGDPPFDELVGVQGDPATWLGLWAPEDRAALAHGARTCGLTVDGGQLRVESRYVPFARPADALDRLTRWARLAQTLAHDPQARAARLLERVRAERGAVRLAALRQLRSMTPTPAEAAAAEAHLRAVAAKGDPVGVPLGILVGDPALATRGLPRAEPATQRWALAALVRLWPEDQVDAELLALLDEPVPTLQAQALRWLGRRRVALPSARLVGLAQAGPRAAEGVLAYLQAAAPAQAEPAWVALVASRHPPVARPAIDRLAEDGGRGAVPALMALEADPELGAAARNALKVIRARLAGLADAGRLAVAGGDAGGLAIADDEAGGLAITDGRT